MLALGGTTHLAVAGAIVATKQITAQASDNRAAVQAKGSAPGMRPAATPRAAEPPPPVVPRGRAYLFRGALGPIFSRGMDRLTEKIQQAGITADVYEFTICSLIASTAIDDYRRDPAPIILIGHSMGGRCALLFSETLQAEGIPVSLVVTIDPAHMSPSVPLNVERFINIFLSKDVLGGGDIKPAPGFPGHYASYDLAEHDEVSHITIDKMDAVHQQLVAKIVQLAATPAKVEGETLPLRYVVPPKEQIELWDSGTAIAARAGDTLQTLASQYGLPLWSLTQINQMPDTAPLAAGQRVIIPRHLVPPLSAVSEPISSRR
ncbi:LysM domain-containing protein [Bradyrhizobium canariense]|uniref:LysM domain-containing protein n=2 Tax=Bradyrhizobium canariense TaxID=255045 RepID=A0A1H1UII6_9BRAD|nr:LysM domain-containing protein [Bradyrhizobium canariense]